MSWNYRVMHHKVGVQEYYGLHEVYYKEDGSVWLWTNDPEVMGDTVDEIGSTLRMMINDFENSKHDVLEYTEPDPEDAA